ncbi:unnamed protein product [Linum trigynum]|uniref:Uncharacterized protein n=1 Tax=Linum trigynum TaxID=586398 RepID=A0AAV2DAG9_9ROSI
MNSQLRSIEAVFKQMVQLERQMKGLNYAKFGVNSLALLAHGGSQCKQGSPQGKNPRDYTPEGRKWWKYCKKENHTIQDCFRLKNKKAREGSDGAPFARVVETTWSKNEGTGNSSRASTDSLANLLTPDQFERLKAMFSGSPSPSPSPPTSPHVP